MLQIQTRNLSDRRFVEIDGHGYTVRKLGAGDELALSQIFRELNKLQDRIKAGKGKLSEAKLNALFDELDDLKQRSLDIYVATFDDGGDGSKSRALVGGLTYDGLSAIYDQIFHADKLAKAAQAEKEGDGPADDRK